MAKKDQQTQENTAQVEPDKHEAVVEIPQEEIIEIAQDSPESGQIEGLSELRQKLDEANEQNIRLLAEFDNFRKRNRREIDGLREYASENVLKALLPVLDDLDRTLTAMEKTDNLSSIKDGIRMVTEKLHKTLEREGLNRVNAVGQAFDSELHEAIHSMEVEAAKKGTVLEEVEKGYRLKDKVIRYAKVIVGE